MHILHAFPVPRSQHSLTRPERKAQPSLAQVEVAFSHADRHCKDPSLGARKAWILRYDTIRYSAVQRSTARYAAAQYTSQGRDVPYTVHHILPASYYIHTYIHTSARR